MTFLVSKKKAWRRESQSWEVQRIWGTAKRLVVDSEKKGYGEVLGGDITDTQGPDHKDPCKSW